MDFLRSLATAAAGLKAQTGRMRMIAENIANVDSTASTPGGDPYRRKVPTFVQHVDRELGATMVQLGTVYRDKTPFRTKIEPGNPAADANGIVKLPNINELIETVDLREAQRSYEANLNVITGTRRMMSRTLDILRA